MIHKLEDEKNVSQYFSIFLSESILLQIYFVYSKMFARFKIFKNSLAPNCILQAVFTSRCVIRCARRLVSF